MPRDDGQETGRSLLELLKAKSRRRRTTLRTSSPCTVPPQVRRNDLCPVLELVERAPDDLTIPGRNIRRLDASHIGRVRQAIAELGFNDPPLIDESDEVIDGVVRVEAAKGLGLLTIPCILVRHLSPRQRRLLRLALNRLQERGSWDLHQLKFMIQDLVLENDPLEITGFTMSEIDQIVLDEEPESVESGPLEPDEDGGSVARLGDIFALDQHRLICGDATDPSVFQALMPRDHIQLVLTDEPYNVAIRGNVTRAAAHREFAMASGEMNDTEFKTFNIAWMEASLPFLVDGGLFATFIDWRGYAIVHAAAVQLGLLLLNLIVWAKTNGGLGSLYRSQHELLPLFKKGTAAHVNNVKLGKDGRWRSNVWQYPGASSLGSDAREGLRVHPTVKPTPMLEDALLDLTNRGDVVLDPFLGSGSMLIAAQKAGRLCRGVEIDPRYIDVAIRRWQRLTGRKAILESTGRLFDQIPSRRADTALQQAVRPQGRRRASGGDA